MRRSSEERYWGIVFATKDRLNSFVTENKTMQKGMTRISSSATSSALASLRNSTLEVRCHILHRIALAVSLCRIRIPLILSGKSFKGIWTVEITSSASKLWFSLGRLKSTWQWSWAIFDYSNWNQASWFRTRSAANGKEGIVHVRNDLSAVAGLFSQFSKSADFRGFIFLE